MEKIGLMVILAFIFTGCTKYVIAPVKDDGKYGEYFEATIQPFNNPNPNAQVLPEKHRENNQAIGFLLTIKNKTDKDLKLNWSKTLFISNGQTDGSFMLGAHLCADRNSEKIHDIIFPNSSLKKRIFPSHLVRGIKGGGCVGGMMGSGKLGVLLNLASGEKQMEKSIFVTIEKEIK